MTTPTPVPATLTDIYIYPGGTVVYVGSDGRCLPATSPIPLPALLWDDIPCDN